MLRARRSTSRYSLADSWLKSACPRPCKSLAPIAASKSRLPSSHPPPPPPPPPAPRLPHTRAPRAGRGFGFGAGQHLCEQLLRDVGVAKIGIEEFTEHHAVLLATDQHGLQRGAEVLPLQTRQQHGLLGQRHARSIDPHASAAQRAAKAAEVVGQFA